METSSLCRHSDYSATVVPSTRVFRTSGRWPSFVRRWKQDLERLERFQCVPVYTKARQELRHLVAGSVPRSC